MSMKNSIDTIWNQTSDLPIRNTAHLLIIIEIIKDARYMYKNNCAVRIRAENKEPNVYPCRNLLFDRLM